MMVNTKYVLEQMRAANPAPSLEQLAVDDLDLVRDIVARERSATTAPVEERQPTRPDPLGRRWRMRPVLVAGLAFVLVLGTLGGALLLFRGGGELATAGFTCPPGSTPDQPGPANQPRPQWEDGFGYATFDPGSGQGLMLNSLGGSFWMFDVCTNTWAAAPRPGGIGFVTDLVYDVDSDRAIAFAVEDDEVAQIWTYEPDEQGWTRKNDLAVDPAWYRDEPVDFAVGFQAVYDPVTGLVVVRAEFTSQMWTYDVETDTWTEVDQGATPPPAVEDGQLLTYDASVDRLILHVISSGYPPTPSTWEFDIRAGRWEERAPDPPSLGFGFWPTGEELIYDEANQVSVVYSFGPPTVATYDASEHSWTILQTGWQQIPPFAYRSLHTMTYDPVNERTLVFGDGDTDDVIAFDAATGEWITILDPTTE